MKYNNLIKSTLLFVTASIIVASCKKEARTNWDTEMLVPIATTNLSLQNLVKDSSIKTNSDQSLTLAFKSGLFQFSLADRLIRIPDTSLGQKFTLDNLLLPNQSVNFKITLGFLANSMLSQPGTNALGNVILTNIGNALQIPAINNFSPGGFHFDATSYFDSAVITSGFVDMWAINDLPVPISSATCILQNSADHSVIASQSISQTINPGDSAFMQIPINNVRITSGLDFQLVNISTPGSAPGSVVIDTTDSFVVKVFIHDLHVSEAWAKFPTQDVVSSVADVTQVIGDRKFTYVDARSGFLHIFITSSIEEKLYLEYTLVGAYDKGGHPLKEYTTVPAAPVGGTVTIDTMINIAGLAINLTGKDGTSFNTYTQGIKAHIDSTGITRHITTADSLHIQYEITEVAPNYVKGYAGRDTISQSDTANFDFLNIFSSGTIDLQDVNMNISVENGIGVDGEVRINNLTALNAHNDSVPLTGPIVGQPLVIARATDFPLTPSVNNFTINSSNSNIKNLLNILPNRLRYNVQVKTNLAGNTQQYRDFAYLESALKLNLNAEIPLSLIANHLVLKDSFAFDLSNTNLNVAGITDGVINLIANNKFPIEAVLTMMMYDENWNPVDTIMIDTHVAAGDLDNSCRVNAFKKTKIPLYVTEERMTNIKRAKHAVINADFSTVSNNATCNGQHLKIYSDYNLDITFTAKFNYKVQTHF